MYLHFFMPSECKTFRNNTQASELPTEPTFVGEPPARSRARVWVYSLRKKICGGQKRETNHPELLFWSHSISTLT